mmetsp:Transcript_39965/g.78589  ORF Transcript_39965/g.78589 Transcript_39965/m.78589 type:complete len:426 (+) Transcript_39965:56-1333(+)|eukprot:CAMPEP_0175140918 /NCGR_PEP_ID=MMETSP0087-20121206/11790_1 /TAXON_ID=136419 /ORGANISM="Unknown Unknown, Strain D1" /LENGTH=425 /DNA_ID=CAMNT_0016424223 /DNA_START=61 /DNA_END=1338 /DNA_ORIENTATION=+
MAALGNKKKEELEKALADYFESSGFTKALAAFTKEAKVTADAQSKGLLIKKWRSIIRQEKRLEELQESNSDLLDEINSDEVKVDSSETLPQNEKAKLTGHRAPITFVKYHPRFNIVVTCSEDHTLRVWDCHTGEYERTLSGHTDTVTSCAFNSKGSLLASTSNDTFVKLWDFGAEMEGTFKCTKTLTGHDHTVSHVIFTQSGDNLYSCSRDKTIKMWETETGHCKTTLQDHSDWVRRVALSPCEKFLASGCMDHTINIWNLQKGSVMWSLRDHDHVVESLAWSNIQADTHIIDKVLEEDDQKVAKTQQKDRANNSIAEVGGMFLVSCSRDKMIRLWFVSEGVCVKNLRGHDNWVRDVLFHPSGRYIISCSDDKSIKCWDLTKFGRCTKTLKSAHSTFVSSIDWNHHHAQLVSGDVQNEIKLWDCS